MNVFFYGLFMDEATLASKGIIPKRAVKGYVDDFELRIGERATLVPSPDARVHGVLMEIAAEEVQRLYEDDNVADYLPEPVTVKLGDSSCVNASCYNLPASKIIGTNRDYARALCELADRLGLDGSYVAGIRRLAQ